MHTQNNLIHSHNMHIVSHMHTHNIKQTETLDDLIHFIPTYPQGVEVRGARASEHQGDESFPRCVS